MLDFSALRAAQLIRIVEGLCKRHAATRGPVPIVAIGHCKNFNLRSRREFESFLRWVNEQTQIAFSTYGRWMKSRERCAGC